MKNWWNRKTKREKRSFFITCGLTIVMLSIFAIVFALASNGNDFCWLAVTLGRGYPNGTNDVLTRLVGTVYYFSLFIGFGYIIQFLLSIAFISANNKALTIGKLIKSTVRYAAALIFLFVDLAVWGVDSNAILISAGVIALVIGLGAQSLIADIIAGVNIVFESEYHVGDIVLLDGFRGTIEEIGLTTTKLIDAAGNEKIINNSKISTIVNLSAHPSLAIVNIGVDYDSDILFVEKVIKDAALDIKEKLPACIDTPRYLGVTELADSSVNIRVVVHCREEDRFQLERDLNKELFILFGQNNINIPFNQVTLSTRDGQPLDPEKVKKFMDAMKK